MPIKRHHSILTIFLIIVVCANLFNVRSVLADGEPPTEPPAPTEVATEPPVESTPDPAEAAATPIAEVLTQVPESTEVVVLDAGGNSVPLATEDAAEIVEMIDPMWCPAGVLPGGPGCSSPYPTISALLSNMRLDTSNYDENGIIYFTATPGGASFILSDAGTSLNSDFDTLKNFNLTLQGGWNGDSGSPSFSGQTNFGTSPIAIGTFANPWVGNITLNDIAFCSAIPCSFISQTSVTVYSTTGNITLSNVDVNNQANGKNTALLSSASGNIAISNGDYDGNSSNSAGFSATTGSGSITITDSSFTENKKPGPTNTFDGATLSAPTVTLTNVTSTGNDGNGITINNANVVTLNNVTASNNGTSISPAGLINNIGSGVFFNGNVGSSLFINGGTFNNNQKYGIEVANTTTYIQSAPTCIGNVGGCSNGTFVVDTTPPILTLPANITIQATGPAGAVVNYSASATDNLDPTVSVTCSPASGSTFALGTTTVNCFSTDTAGNTALGSFQVTVESTTVIIPTLPTNTLDPSSQSSTSGSSTSQSNSSAFVIPLTGGELIHLDCNSVFWAFGIKLSFLNLCDQQTMINSIGANNLPGQLPNGFSFVMGLDVDVLSANQSVEALPNGTGIQMDFPISGSQEQFAVLYWNGSEWVEVSRQVSGDKIPQVMNADAGDEFYQIQNTATDFFQILTTGKTGIFVLAKK